MTADPSPTHKAVAVVLRETPLDPEGRGVVSIDEEPAGGWFASYGPPEPIAARQAAAVLRWLAKFRRDNHAEVLDATELDELADEIDPKEGDDDGHR